MASPEWPQVQMALESPTLHPCWMTSVVPCSEDVAAGTPPNVDSAQPQTSGSHRKGSVWVGTQPAVALGVAVSVAVACAVVVSLGVRRWRSWRWSGPYI